MSELLDWADGTPRSPRYGDVYFSAVDGLAEARSVFLQGCDLPNAWAGRRRFVVAEIGLGTGLNLLALLDLWRRSRPEGGLLHVFTIEGHLLAARDVEKALAAWPELADLAAALVAVWPSPRPGFHRLEFPALNAIVDVAIGEAAEVLAAWSGAADAWFLDGFAPAKNPEAWRQAVLDLVAARSAPGARAATFTVAGAVRRGLATAGFTVEKRPGFGRKRERLEARLGDGPLATASEPRVAVIGAGIAGAALARAFRSLGTPVTVFEGAAVGAGASGAPSALVSPRLDAGGGAPAQLHAQAIARARAIYLTEAPEAVLAQGAMQIEGQDRDAARFDRVAAWAGFAPGDIERLGAEAVARRLAEPAAPAGLAVNEALVVAPDRLLKALLADTPLDLRRVTALEKIGGAWRLLNAEGDCLAEADVVCLAAGADEFARQPTDSRVLPLRPVRGQVSCSEVAFTGQAAGWGGYAAPLRGGGTLFGATHDRDDVETDVRELDHGRNLALLAKARPALAARIASAGGLQGWAGVRAATPDHLPVAGGLAEGLMILGGLAGRGFTLAPLLAEHVAALAVGAASPLPRILAAAVDPRRFWDELDGRRMGSTIKASGEGP
ncbi:MAG: tRNA (5-methylaminomethyl-2-thiouridine)(34)-methyltransferase MnmD [Caulobacteraceae bacterium]